MHNSKYNNHDLGGNDEDKIDFKNILTKFYDKWIWFLISIVLCLIIGAIYNTYTAPTYQIGARLLINDNDKGSSGASSGALMDFGGLIGGKSSVDNESEILKTRFLMEQVVRQMQLNIIYSQKQSFYSREIYQAPFKLQIEKGVDTISSTVLKVQQSTGNKLKVKADNEEYVVSWNERFKVDGVGTVYLSNTDNEGKLKGEFEVKIVSIDERVSNLMRQLSVKVGNKLSTIIDLGLSYPIQKKGEDILNTIISRYINSSLEDKNTIADSTTKFIQNRLSIISNELGDVENNQETFKRENKLADLSEQSKLLVQNTSEYRNDLAKAETQVIIVEDLEAYLKDETKNKRVFPTALLPSDMVFSGLMNQYNALLIERDRQLLSVTEDSPFIKNIDSQIASLRKGILGNIQSTKNTYVVTRDKLRNQLSQIENRVEKVPQIEKNYLKLARNQGIKQELFIFLMQKAEETAISKTSNISIAKTIDPPKADATPISPKKNLVYLCSLFFGFAIPIGLLFVAELLNTTITTKEEVESGVDVPIIGEISHNADNDNLIVANQERSTISEQFRALRTNLSFYLKNDDEKVILLTSSSSGEGKSFTAINLGNILALAGKKVLLMELDLRKPGLSEKLGVSNKVGFSNFTIDKTIQMEHIIKPLSINKNIFIISSGPLPPNPAETLMSDRTEKLIADLKMQFDYIIMDAPPIGVITDAQLLAKYADMTLYLIRHKVTQKAHLSIINDLYNSKKMKNIAIVVNDINTKHYGYGYGYGNYGQEKETENWFTNLFTKIRG
ncbi:GumC family protein [Pedobacter sp. MR22-3]|uniref:GumC family protein n=1 Tax=Pedobacter sp. MR22-3 TaxID=2994552 RepID=UPI00224728FD|nr:tyrosine-protein kinase [Pedobacter sp. MR22-3]MCX2582886.1 polysaccharide biosynthesis tyrosine autokinase [Pedobacter sp. MR22-3]